jgi:hypothetical protein
MKRISASFVASLAGLLGLFTAGWLLANPVAAPSNEGIPTDWSHAHVIFSQPATIDRLSRVTADPRFWQQWYRQSAVHHVSSEVSGTGLVTPFSATSGSAVVQKDWAENLGSGGTIGAGNFPAKYSFRINSANCASAATPDYVVFNTGLAPSSGQPSIIAYDNLYSGCGSTVPTVYWAYNTGGTVVTSPVISFDGTQVAFVQTAGGAASVVFVYWKPGTGTFSSPVSPTSVSSSAYSTCTAPCMTTVNLHTGSGGTENDTTSSPFPVYNQNVIFVGGASGWLHKITGAFTAPTEATTGGFPVQPNPTGATALTGPAYDSVSGKVFVADAGGYLYSVSATGSVTKSARLDFKTMVAAPVIDSAAQKVYAFATNDSSGACTGGISCAGIFVFSTGFPAGNGGSEAKVGTSGATPNPLFGPGFDSLYLASSNATGNLYICGGTGIDPTLYRVPITGGVFGTPAAVAILTPTANTPPCSPVTDIANPNAPGGSTERVFFGVTTAAHPTLCAGGGCAISFITSPWRASTSYTKGQEILVLNGSTTYMNVAVASGTSGTTAPTWPTTIGNVTVDGGMQWLNQGPTTVTPLSGWQGSHRYALRSRIIDSNGFVEIATTAGISGSTSPAWSTTAGATLGDGSVTWTNAGAWPSSAIPAAGGTSGFIIDNIVGPTTLSGASQVYFSTLTNQTCGSTGTGGCAVQASQFTLQ